MSFNRPFRHIGQLISIPGRLERLHKISKHRAIVRYALNPLRIWLDVREQVEVFIVFIGPAFPVAQGFL